METAPLEPFATIDDVIELYRALTPEEIKRAEALLPVISDTIRIEADRVGRDIDTMVYDPSYANVVRLVVIDVLIRTLNSGTAVSVDNNLSQFSQSALGYSVSGTFMNAGGGLFIKNSELARLGLRKQRYGVIDFYENPWDTDNTI